MKERFRLSYTATTLLFLFTLNFSVSAQVSTGFTFSTANPSKGSLGLPIAGGTVLASGSTGTGTDDQVYPNNPIGFTFRFNGNNYTQVGISSNGFIWFGNTAPATTEYNPISSNFGAAGVVSVFGQSLVGRDDGTLSDLSTISYQTLGTAPNRTLVVQWYDYSGKSDLDKTQDITGTYNTNRMDLWVILYECSGVIKTAITSNEYWWDPSASLTGEVGIRGATNGDFYNCSYNCGANFKPTAPTGSNTTPTQIGDANGCYPGTFNGVSGSPCVWDFTPNNFTVPVINCNAPGPACTGTPETITVNGSGGLIPYTINWIATGAGAAPPSGNAGNINSLPYTGISTTFSSAGTGNYAVTLTDNIGCMATCNGVVTVNVCTTDTITTGNVTGGPFCACGNINIPFTSTGIFNAGNVYTAELSDSSGSFANPVNIGSISSTANSGTILNCNIPCNTPTGTLYQVRVVSDNPGVIGTPSVVNITIVGTTPPTVNIFVSPTLICSGGTIQCTATAQNAAGPVYQWFVNGQPEGTDSIGFTTALTNPTSSDDTFLVSCIIINTTGCGTTSDTSNTVPVIVSSVNPAAVSITASPGTSICPGTQITFTATPVNGGPLPSYQWYVDGAAVGGNSDTYSSSTLSNGDSVYCTLTSSNFCANPATGTSDTLGITANPPVTPSVTISASQTTICLGAPVTFTPVPVNGGPTPSYQWMVNGNQVSTASVFTADSLSDSSVVNCIMTTSLGCVTNATDTSNSIMILVITAPVLTITPASPIIECTGTPVPMTVSGADSYTWSPADGLSCVNCPNPILNATVSGIYTVIGTLNNCVSRDSIAVVVRCPGNFVPSAFSPNGDGINDVLTVLGPSISNFNFKIFNRWGEKVFETNDQNFGWDGTYKLQKAPMGVYVWEVSGIDKSGNKVLIDGKNSGNVTLMR